MERVDFLPLGSIVVMKGNIKKAMIIARGLATSIEEKTKYFDYGGCLYPEGLISDRIIYFNHSDIAKVVFNGFSDEDNNMMVDNINDWLEKSGFERGDINMSKQSGDNTSKGE